MANGVGLWIGAAQSTAVVIRDGATSETAQRTGPIATTGTGPIAGIENIVRDTVLYMSADGTALGHPVADDAVAVSDFVDRIGDPAGVTLGDGAAYRAEDLYATALYCLLDLATADLTGDTEIVAAHPSTWPAEFRTAVRDSLDYLGLRHVRLEQAAAADGTGAVAEPARVAAGVALASAVAGADEPPTEEFPVIGGAMVDEQAYSALIPVVSAADTVLLPAAAPVRIAPTTAAPPLRVSRTPLLVAAGFAAALALAGATIAFALRADTSSEIPEIIAAGPAPTTTEPPPAPAPVLPAAVEPISFPTVTTTVEAPTSTPVWTPPPGPIVEVAAPLPPPVETPPPTTTTTPPTTTPETTTPTPDPTEEETEPAPTEPTEEGAAGDPATGEQDGSPFEAPEGTRTNRDGTETEADFPSAPSRLSPYDTGRDYDYYFGDTDNLGDP
jgi:hypothetical protein